ncbi:recombinase family protein [Bosea thiooxidans]|nr:recombinase family protein [Bosea sp. (in: a-proteobacteria)]
MAGMLVGFARTSTVDQQAGLEAQERDLKAAGAEKVFSEQVSSIAKREKLEAAIEFCRAGDTLVVTRVDRLSRGVADLLSIIERLEKKGVALRILSFGGGVLDTSNATSTLILTVLAATASWERSVMLERQREGIMKAKLEGKYKGRAPTARRQGEAVRALHAEGAKVVEIVRQVGISRASVYRCLKSAATTAEF